MVAALNNIYATAPKELNLIGIHQPISTTGLAGGVGGEAFVGQRQALGTMVPFSWGIAAYGVATATLTKGYLCYFYMDGTYAKTQPWGAALATTSIVSTVPYMLGTPLSTLTVGQFGWFWVGCGMGQVYCTTGISIGTALTTHTVAGQASTGGTAIRACPINTTTAAVCVVSAPTFLTVNYQ